MPRHALPLWRQGSVDKGSESLSLNVQRTAVSRGESRTAMPHRDHSRFGLPVSVGYGRAKAVPTAGL